jgi:hypothetical protein
LLGQLPSRYAIDAVAAHLRGRAFLHALLTTGAMTMDAIGYLIVLLAVGVTAAVMARPAARRGVGTTDSKIADRREAADVLDDDLWGNCSQCRGWFALDMTGAQGWDCPDCRGEPREILNRRLQPLPAFTRKPLDLPGRQPPGSAT